MNIIPHWRRASHSLLWAGLLSACTTLPPQPPSTTTISQQPAVLNLVQTARNHRAAGHPQHARASLERALRLEPRNAWLWFELAQLHQQDQQPQAAKNLGLRARSMTDDPQLRRQVDAFLRGLP